MQLNSLKRKTENKKARRVGRGNASGLGKTSGRGTKGQNARAGHKKRPDVREQLKKLPKLRGRGVNSLLSIQAKPAVVNLSSLEGIFAAGDAITPASLMERGLVRARKGTTPVVKILGGGDITKKLSISGCSVSGQAREKIEKAGGSVV